MDRDVLVDAACAEIVQYTRDRRACLIFATGVKHDRHIVRVLHEKHGIECGFVSGELAESGALAPTDYITVRSVAGEPHEGIVDYELGEIPESAVVTSAFDESDIPF